MCGLISFAGASAARFFLRLSMSLTERRDSAEAPVAASQASHRTSRGTVTDYNCIRSATRCSKASHHTSRGPEQNEKSILFPQNKAKLEPKRGEVK